MSLIAGLLSVHRLLRHHAGLLHRHAAHRHLVGSRRRGGRGSRLLHHAAHRRLSVHRLLLGHHLSVLHLGLWRCHLLLRRLLSHLNLLGLSCALCRGSCQHYDLVFFVATTATLATAAAAASNDRGNEQQRDQDCNDDSRHVHRLLFGVISVTDPLEVAVEPAADADGAGTVKVVGLSANAADERQFPDELLTEGGLHVPGGNGLVLGGVLEVVEAVVAFDAILLIAVRLVGSNALGGAVGPGDLEILD